MTRLFVLAILFFFFSQEIIAQPLEDKSNQYPVEKEFAFNMIRSITERRCDEYYNNLHDTILLLQKKNQFLIKKQMESKIKSVCINSIRNDSVTFDFYLKNFQHIVLDSAAIMQHPVMKDLFTKNPLYTLKEGDFFFSGGTIKKGNSMSYILDDMFVFLFRKINGKYVVIAWV